MKKRVLYDTNVVLDFRCIVTTGLIILIVVFRNGYLITIRNKTMYVETQEIPHFTPSKLESLRYGVSIRQQLLHQIITTFETRYNCSLSELEGKLETLEIDEHPVWEDSIEWRNGVEQLLNPDLPDLRINRIKTKPRYSS